MAPTLLALLNISYDSRFFGQDILREGRTHQRAFLSNYQTVGYYERGRIVELRPHGRVRVVVGRRRQAGAGRRAEPRTAGRGHQLLPAGVTGLPQRRDEVAPLTTRSPWCVRRIAVGAETPVGPRCQKRQATMAAMKIDGIEVQVEGDGAEAVVMIHGWPDTLRLWDRTVEALNHCTA